MTLGPFFLISLQQKCLMIDPGQSLLKISFIPAIIFHVYMGGQGTSLFKPEVAGRLLPDSDREVCGPAPVTLMARSPGETEQGGGQPQPAGHHRDAHHHQQGAAALALQKPVITELV